MNTIKLGICDDQSFTINKIKEICQNFFNKNNLPCELFCFNNGIELFQCNQKLDILILDVEMPELTGIEIKQMLQEKQADTFILFVTNHEFYMKEAFGRNVMGFLLKEHLEKLLPNELNNMIKLIRKTVFIQGNINSEKIIYVQAESNYSRIFMEDTQQLLRITLGELEKQLCHSDFVRIHKSYLVNVSYITDIKDKHIIIHNQQLPISIRKVKEVTNVYHSYLKKNARYY